MDPQIASLCSVTIGALHLQQAGEDEEVRGAATVLVRLLVAARGDVILVRPAEPADQSQLTIVVT